MSKCACLSPPPPVLHEWYHTVHTASIVFRLKVSRRLVFILCRGLPHTFLWLNEWQSIARVTVDDHSLSNQFLVLGIYTVSSLLSKRVTAVSNLPCVLHMCLSVCRASSQSRAAGVQECAFLNVGTLCPVTLCVVCTHLHSCR